MLKNNDGLTACSLTGCRIKAEALARALNSRIWPCTWVDRRTGDGDGMGEEDEEEFFEASPSPVEVEGESRKAPNCSAATEEGRAKLYELLQQHASDDATDVFYDVSEQAGVSENDGGNLRENYPSVDDTFREVKLRDSADCCETADFTRGEASVCLSGCCDSCEVPSDPNPQISLAMKGNSVISEMPDGLKTSSFEGDEFLSVRINSNSDDVHEIETRNSQDETSETCAENSTVDDTNVSIEPSQGNVTNGSEETNEYVIDVKITNEYRECGGLESGKLHSPDATSDNCRLKVFTELRPMISRSTSLKTGKTPPSTPNRKKIVRFADVLGLDLEDVRHIISGDLPNIPSSAYDDLDLKDLPTVSPVPVSNIVELSGRQQGSWDSVTAATGPNALYPNFQIPGQQANFMDRVRCLGICLESLVIAECNVQGTCRVMNWDFNKRVVVRYTTNGWASTSDINASYVSGSTREDTDSFAFNIFLSPFHSSVEFALCYTVKGRDYWDNNTGVNYHLSRHGNGVISQDVSVPCSPSWMDQFW